MDAALRQFVRMRAKQRCEYCRLPQTAAPYLTFHIEHIEAQQHVEDDTPENLALACPDCNRHKGPNLVTLDSLTREIVPLFHPRRDVWEDHFRYDGAILEGRSAVGEATIRLLQINTVERVEMRAELINCGDM
jgi:HNH endonuclease